MKPLSLALHEHQLYVLGFMSDGVLRNVRFSRVIAALKMKERFEYPPLDDYDPRLVFRDSLGIFIHDDDREGIRVRDVQIRLSHRWSSYVETHRWHESQRHTVDSSGVLLELHVRTCPELERLILGFGPDAEVLAPMDLRKRIALKAGGIGGSVQPLAPNQEEKCAEVAKATRLESLVDLEVLSRARLVAGSIFDVHGARDLGSASTC